MFSAWRVGHNSRYEGKSLYFYLFTRVFQTCERALKQNLSMFPFVRKTNEIYADINFINDKNMFRFANYLCRVQPHPQLLASDFWNLHTALTLECASEKKKLKISLQTAVKPDILDLQPPSRPELGRRYMCAARKTGIKLKSQLTRKLW